MLQYSNSLCDYIAPAAGLLHSLLSTAQYNLNSQNTTAGLPFHVRFTFEVLYHLKHRRYFLTTILHHSSIVMLYTPSIIAQCLLIGLQSIILVAFINLFIHSLTTLFIQSNRLFHFRSYSICCKMCCKIFVNTELQIDSNLTYLLLLKSALS